MKNTQHPWSDPIIRKEDGELVGFQATGIKNKDLGRLLANLAEEYFYATEFKRIDGPVGDEDCGIVIVSLDGLRNGKESLWGIIALNYAHEVRHPYTADYFTLYVPEKRTDEFSYLNRKERR
jgi:hypothetical protein